jgi:YVTN family beta-propeller protein
VQYPSNPGASAPQCQPYGVTLSADGKTAYVSDWGEHSVSMISTATHSLMGKVTVGTHPMALETNPVSARHEVYVANGDGDSVSVIDTSTNTVSRTLDLAPYQAAPVGSNPDALAVSADGRTLYVSNGGNNDVAVIDLDASTNPIQGMIPTAWYPTGVRLSKDGQTLYVINAKGLGAGPNPAYQQGKYAPPQQYVGSMMHGTLSVVSSPAGPGLQRYTEQVVRNNGFDERDKVRSAQNGEGDEGGSVIPRRVGDPSPIKHVIYVVKENRTYDEVLGSLGKGNGDPSLNLFGEDSAPNIRDLARQFVTLDNFYASAEVSADGWNWSTAANANNYVQRMWPANYSGRGRGYDFEGGNYATAPNVDPHNAYLWDRLAGAGKTFRNYGFFTVFGSSPAVPEPTAKNLQGRTSPTFPGYNLSIADSPCGPASLTKPSRYTEWENEFKHYEAGSDLPAFEFVRFPNDHTRGTSPGAETPRRYVADNDYAVGKLVDTVSHSKYWSSTAIFVVEDDAQDGPDHVDAHRTEALVVSPYTQTGKVDSTLYGTVSMLRTMELVSGLKPLTQFDASATPMLNSFSSKPNTKAYAARVPQVLSPECPTGQGASGATTNTADSPMAAESAAMNFDTADAPDNRLLNQAIWQSVKGADSPMPEPKNATMAPPTPSRDADG